MVASRVRRPGPGVREPRDRGAALRFSWRGESDLDFEQAGIASRIDDAVRAAEVLLEQQPTLAGISLLGHRLGGAIAAAAAARLRCARSGFSVGSAAERARVPDAAAALDLASRWREMARRRAPARP